MMWLGLVGQVEFSTFWFGSVCRVWFGTSGLVEYVGLGLARKVGSVLENSLFALHSDLTLWTSNLHL